MNLPKHDFNKLYQLQDKVLAAVAEMKLPFYLTGGTALGRFYLNHRYSEDLDFFVNAHPAYGDLSKGMYRKLNDKFNIDKDAVLEEDFSRFYVRDGEETLKIECINDVPYRLGEPKQTSWGLLDSVENILANKLSALIGRDEPKDLFDIIQIARNYSFNWKDIFLEARKKVHLNELEFEERILSFPISFFEKVNWTNKPMDLNEYEAAKIQIADDFLLGYDNSLGIGKVPIGQAVPKIHD
ncbi:MAG TPA: hypothetical protein DIW47_02365 [Bacteroidetes bacterium]|nr:hypothetical protein [Bacteroidota bacterium]